MTANAASPKASIADSPGSGVVMGGPPPPIVPPLPPGPFPVVCLQPPVAPGVEMVLSISVTEASREMTLPHPMVAPLSRESPALEIIVPRNELVEPSVAEDPTSQVMLPVNGPEPVSTTSTLEALAVVSPAGIWKIQLALLSAPALRKSVPFKRTVVELKE